MDHLTENSAVESLVNSGLAKDRKVSRRIVREVIKCVLTDSPGVLKINTGDLHSLDELTAEMDSIVWDLDDFPDMDHRHHLLMLVSKAKGVLRIARGYVEPNQEETQL